MYKYHTKDITLTINGQRVRKKVRGKTKKELEQKILELRMRESAGELDTYNDKTTFGDWFNIWIQTYKKPTVSEKEYQRYICARDNYILPGIGKIKLTRLTNLDLQNYLNLFAGKSKSYIDFQLKAIRACVRRAAQNNLLNEKILLDLLPPSGTQGTRRPLTIEERKAFFAVMDKHPHGIMFGMMLACGLRPGEIRALLQINVNIFNGEVSIFDAVKSGTKNTVGKPKSEAGVRICKMPSWYLNKYREYIKTNESVYVFPSGATGQIMSQQHFDRSWSSFKRLMDIEMGAKLYRNKIIESKIDSELTSYYLRHTFCTDLATAGVPLKTAQYLMGHASPEITAKIYSHYQAETRDAAVSALNNYQTKKFELNLENPFNENAL